VNCFGRRIGIKRAKKYQPRVQIVARSNFDGLSRGIAVADQDDVILKGSDLDGPPVNTLDHSGVLLWTDYDNVAHLEGTVGVQGNAGEEISQRVLQREADDYAKNGRGGEKGAEIYLFVNVIEDQNK
jgi:hypothetical protein